MKIKRISFIHDNEYEVLFEDVDGSIISVLCKVVYKRGIPLIQPRPDIFMDGRAYARDIADAVIAFHNARSRT